MYQTNGIALRSERFIDFQALPGSVAFIGGTNYLLSVGSTMTTMSGYTDALLEVMKGLETKILKQTNARLGEPEQRIATLDGSV